MVDFYDSDMFTFHKVEMHLCLPGI